jgi:hypothetical protein
VFGGYKSRFPLLYYTVVKCKLVNTSWATPMGERQRGWRLPSEALGAYDKSIEILGRAK